MNSLTMGEVRRNAVIRMLNLTSIDPLIVEDELSYEPSTIDRIFMGLTYVCKGTYEDIRSILYFEDEAQNRTKLASVISLEKAIKERRKK